MRLKDFESRRVDELAPATLASYKKKAGAAATAADAAGDVKTADKRFSGIVKATKKQFDQDAKGVSEGSSDTVYSGAEDLSIGDPVIITGKGIEFEGTTGEISDFGDMKRFVVVNLYNHGPHSFHSSDVSFNEYAGSDEEEARMYDTDPDARAHGVNEQGVAEGSEQKPAITYKDYTLQYDYQTEDDDPEGYSTATTYYFDVLKDGDRVGEAEYFDYFGNLTIRINGKTKEFGFRHPLASQISQLVSSLPDEQKKDLSDPRFESQDLTEVFADQGSGSTDRDNADYMKRRRAAKNTAARGSVTKKPQPYNDPNWIDKLSKEQLDALAGRNRNKDKKDVAEADLDKFKKYTRTVTKTTPKIERTTNPAGRTTDHVEWRVTTPTGEIHRYKSKKQAQEHFDSFDHQGVSEGKADYNFDIEDLKRLERIRDLPTLKTQAMMLIGKPSAKPMRPEKVEWFKNALERMTSPMAVIKLMYDLLLSGEGHSVVGSRSSMNPNSYRQRFNEQDAAEDSLAAMRRLAGIVPQVPLIVPNGQRQYRHMPTAVQPR